MTGLIMPWSAGMLSGGKNLIVSSNRPSAILNNNTWNFGAVSLGATAVAGDLIVVCVTSTDVLGGYTSSYTLSGTWSNVVFQRYTNGPQNHAIIAWKSASGGETSITVSGTWTGLPLPTDDTDCYVFLIRGLSSNTAINSGNANAANTTGAALVISSVAGGGWTGNGGAVTTFGMTTSVFKAALVDEAPPGGTVDYPSGANAGVYAAWA